MNDIESSNPLAILFWVAILSADPIIWRKTAWLAAKKRSLLTPQKERKKKKTRLTWESLPNKKIIFAKMFKPSPLKKRLFAGGLSALSFCGKIGIQGETLMAQHSLPLIKGEVDFFHRKSSHGHLLVGGWTNPFENFSQIGNLPQIGVKIKSIWNHHLVYSWLQNSNVVSLSSFFEVEMKSSTPPKTNMEPQKWRFGSYDFPFQGPVIFRWATKKKLLLSTILVV